MQVLLIVVYVLAPFLLLRVHRFWGVPLAILALWLPIETGLFARAGVSSALTVALAVLTGLFVFRSRRDVLNASLTFNLAHFDPRRAVMYWVLFAVMAVPLGLYLNFIRFNFNASELTGAPLLFATILLLNAIPEEILFRALIQNWLENRIGNRTVSLALAALIFGAAHLNNGSPRPNYTYFIMATIAGVFYGLAWREHKNVLTSGLTHTLVNLGWSLLFR